MAGISSMEKLLPAVGFLFLFLSLVFLGLLLDWMRGYYDGRTHLYDNTGGTGLFPLRARFE